MSLIRRDIRRSFAEILTGNTAAGDRVGTNRTDQPWKAGLPALSIYTLDDPAKIDTEGPRLYRRELDVDVELFVRQTGGGIVDDDVDELAQQVYDLIEINLKTLVDTFEGDLGASGFLGEQLDFSGEGSKPLGGDRMRWRFVYFQGVPTDEAALSQLEGVDVQWNLPDSATPELEAVDAIDPPPL